MDIIQNLNSNNNYTIPSHFHPLTLTNFHPKPRKKRTPKLNTSHGTDSSISKPKPTRKPDPTAPKITRPCTECGKKFWSWKALFGHMRCHPERKWRGINPPENLRQPDLSENNEYNEEYSSNVAEEDQEMATCLLLLASGLTRFPEQSPSMTTVNQVSEYSDEPNTFECSSCKKVFGSHQALGGHRASHKNVKGCYANNRNYEDGEEKKVEDEVCCGEDSVGHKCGICWRVFSSGQALGGHMRCHWEPSTSTSIISSPIRVSGTNTNNTGFDLNIPFHHELTLDLSLGL